MMNLEEIKTKVTRMSEQQQDHLPAYLVHLRHTRDSRIRREITSKAYSSDHDTLPSIHGDSFRRHPPRISPCLGTQQNPRSKRASGNHSKRRFSYSV